MRGSELIAEFLKHSKFVRHLSMELRKIGDDRAVLALPFAEELVTIGDVVHGGAASEVKVAGEADETMVATGLVTYKLG